MSSIGDRLRRLLRRTTTEKAAGDRRLHAAPSTGSTASDGSSQPLSTRSADVPNPSGMSSPPDWGDSARPEVPEKPDSVVATPPSDCAHSTGCRISIGGRRISIGGRRSGTESTKYKHRPWWTVRREQRPFLTLPEPAPHKPAPGPPTNTPKARQYGDPVPWPTGDPLAGHKRYRNLRYLSRGSCGFVLLCEDTFGTHRWVAIKFIERGPNFNAAVVRRELANQELCRGHPHIVQLLDVFAVPGYLAIAMEYANHGDLATYISDHVEEHKRGLPEKWVRPLLQQLLTALRFAHDRGIANRDVKLDNILLHEDMSSPGGSLTLKLCDWGFSKNAQLASRCKTMCGTPEYMAPEVLSAGKYDGTLADVWGAGVVMYMLLAGAFPFLTAAEEALSPPKRFGAMLPRISAGRPNALPQPVSPPCAELLAGLLNADPAARLTLPQALAHPWLATDMPPQLASMNARLEAEAEATMTARPTFIGA